MIVVNLMFCYGEYYSEMAYCSYNSQTLRKHTTASDGSRFSCCGPSPMGTRVIIRVGLPGRRELECQLLPIAQDGACCVGTHQGHCLIG